MNKNKKQRGFTIVELVIVIAVIGILAAVLIPTFTNLVKKAKESADQQLVYHINVAAAANEVENGKASTMYDTLQALENGYGFTIEKMTPRSGCDIVWDSVTNRFALVENGTTIKYGDPDPERKSNMANKAQMWKITTPTDSLEDGYSHYLTAGWTGAVEVETGVDVGENDDITSVNYANDGEAQDVVIRTNGANTTLTIDDKSTGTINHYGSAGELNIIQCHTASYHENGNVAFAEIATGRIVLESGSEIKQIHINKKTTSTFDTVIITDNGAKELPEKITRDEVSVASATQVVVVEPKGAPAETVYVYPDGSTGHIGTTEKTETQNTIVESPLGQLVLDNGSSGDKALTEEQKEDNKEEVIEVAKDNEKADVSVKVTINDVSTLMSLAEFRNNVNNDVEGYKTANVELMCNINLGGIEWTPIKEFSGVFDGKGFTISNYTVNTPGDRTGTGLFKKLSGNVNEEFEDLDDVYNPSTHEFSESKITENKYTCVIKNLKFSKVTAYSHFLTKEADDGNRYTSILAGKAYNAYISNIEVSNSSIIDVYKYGAAIAGYINGTVVKDCVISGDTTISAVEGSNKCGHVTSIAAEGDAYGRKNAIINITNNATITGGYGNIAGISCIGKNILHYNCVNNGTINLGADNNACGGICGNGDGSWFVMCTNNGDINATNHTGQIAGILGFKQNQGTSCFYKCYNYGNITNSGDNATAKIAGISCDGTVDNSYEDVANYGVLHGDYATNIYNISTNNAMGLNITTTMTFAELVAELNTKNASSVNITAEITGELGTLVLPANTTVFSASSAVATAFDLSQLPGNRVTINMPGSFELVNINGKSVTISGNSNVTVGSSENGGSVSLRGQVTSLTNNGTLEHVYFTGTGVYTLTNNGTISYTQSESDIYGNKHTVDSITACTITIHNYGTIEANKNSNDVCSYALLFYNGCDVTFYAYENSTVRCNALNRSLLATTSNSRVTLLYKEGAKFIYGTSEYSYPPFHSENVIVSKIA